MKEKYNKTEIMSSIACLSEEEYNAIRCYPIKELEEIFADEDETYDVNYYANKLMEESARCRNASMALRKIKLYLCEIRKAQYKIEQEKLKKMEEKLKGKKADNEHSLISWYSSKSDESRKNSHPCGLTGGVTDGR